MTNVPKSYDIQIKTQLGMPIRPIWAISGLTTIPAVDGLVSGLLGGIRQKFCVDADLGCRKDGNTLCSGS